MLKSQFWLIKMEVVLEIVFDHPWISLCVFYWVL